MLVRDIPLKRAILDLVDNSIDGATKLNNSDYSDFLIEIELTEKYLKIKDNCGGISIDVAEKYAFKFGRVHSAEETPKSIGKFGIGMKRAFFKLGNKFIVESKTTTSSFVIEENVEEWKNNPDWTFKFKEIQEDIHNDPKNIGTLIMVDELHNVVSSNFKQENFRSGLKEELRLAYSLIIQRGLQISFNLNQLICNPLNFRISSSIKVAKTEEVIPFFDNKEQDSPVNIKLYAGVSDRRLESGGWYIFCNNRMILEADQTEITGWGDGLPKYHADFAYFRGYAFLESDDAANLPWTTTKTGINEDSPVYKSLKLKITKITSPVLTFLRKMETERSSVNQGELDESLLANDYEKTELKSFFEIDESGFCNRFEIPEESNRSSTLRYKTITYKKLVEEIEQAKNLLSVQTNKEVGERTFEYFLNQEGDN
jgi:hypothetical protein